MAALPVALALLLAPWRANAQIDALIDAVVDAVEPTPVYDTGLRLATEDLAAKIDRLNRVLFGGAEETSAAWRYTTMYSDLYDLTTAFSGFVDRAWGNARRLEDAYSRLDSGGAAEAAAAIRTAWDGYESTVRTGSAVIARFKKLFSDPGVTNAEVRQAAREAARELKAEEARGTRRTLEELHTAEIAAGLVECSLAIAPSPEAYVAEGRRLYGTTVSEGGSGSATGTLGTAVMVVLGLLCVVYGTYAGIHLMKGTPDAETIIVRLLALLAVSLTTILAIQSYI